MYQFLDKAIPTAKCVFCGQSQFSVAVYYQPKRGTTYRPDGTPHFVEAICEDCLIENLLMDNAADETGEAEDERANNNAIKQHKQQTQRRQGLFGKDEGGYDNG